MLALIYNDLLLCTTRFCVQDLWISLLTKRQLEKLSLHLLYYKTNQYSFSSLHTHGHPWELVSCACVEITFLNATTKWGRCKWLYHLLLFFCSSALGWCIRGRVGCNAAWSINQQSSCYGTKVHLQWTRQNEARLLQTLLWFFSCGYSDSFFSSNCFTRTGLDRPCVSLCTSPINLFRTFRFPAFITITFKEKKQKHNNRTTDTTVTGKSDIFTHSQPRYE